MTSSALRVGVVVPSFTPFRGGMETYVLRAVAAMAASGAEMTVITQVPRAAGLPRQVVCDGYTVVENADATGRLPQFQALGGSVSRRRG